MNKIPSFGLLVRENANAGKPEPVARLTSAQHASYNQAIVELYALEHQRMPLELVKSSYSHLEETFRGLADHSFNPVLVGAGVGAAVLGFLAATRLFSDHGQRAVTKRFGGTSRELAEFRAAEAHAFDTSFDYRFVCRARNYVQHRGFPFSTISSLVLSVEGGSLRVRTRLIWEPRTLLADYDGWGPVARDLQRRKQPLQIVPIAKRAMKAFQRLDAVMQRQTLSHVIAARDFLLNNLPTDWEGTQYSLVRLAPVTRQLRRHVPGARITVRLTPVPRHILSQLKQWTPPNKRLKLAAPVPISSR